MPPGYERSGNPEIPSWWMVRARKLIEDTTMAKVARDASEAAGRESPWDATAISKFFNEEKPVGRTPELANAISAALKLPPPFFVAPTQEIAERLQLIVCGSSSASNPDRDARLVALDQVAEQERQAAIDQTKPVASADEGTDRGGGARRSTRRGT